MGLKNLLLFCGGSSLEHEISLQSARFVAEHVDPTKYRLFVVVIDHDQEWHLVPYAAFREKTLGNRPDVQKTQGKSVYLRRQGGLARLVGEDFSEIIHMVFPMIHGTGGEDGSLQGLLDYVGVPYVGNGVLASALTMDKIATKHILRSYSYPVVPFIEVSCPEKLPSYTLACETLKSQDLVIKPACCGSSVGVSKVSCEEDYWKKSALAFSCDQRILIEVAITGAEVECAVLGNGKAKVSGVGEIMVHNPDKMYSYEAKYQDPHQRQATVHLQAQSLRQEIQEGLRSMALEVFHALSCSGLARLDFFVTGEGEIFVNEVNTIPGFTAISLYPQLWQAAGVSPAELIAELISCAQERFDGRAMLVRQAKDLVQL